MAFKLGVRNSPRAGKARKGVQPPTFADFCAMVAASRLTTDEAKVICCRLLRQTRDWQRPPALTDRAIYRAPTVEEASEVEVPS